MLFDVYAIKDLEKGDYAQPFFVPQGTDVKSIKINFKRLIEKGDSELSYFPERFELHILCTFDSSVGLFAVGDCEGLVPCIAVVCKGIDFARPEYLKALAEAKKIMENDEEKVD